MVALLWRAVTAARELPPQQRTAVHVAVDVRRLRTRDGQPLLPATLLGSAVLPAVASLRAEQVLAAPLGRLARLVRATVRSMTAEVVAATAGTAAAGLRAGRHPSIVRNPVSDLTVSNISSVGAQLLAGVSVHVPIAGSGSASVVGGGVAGAKSFDVLLSLPAEQLERAEREWAETLAQATRS